MIEYLNLFKALPVKERTSTFSTDFIKHGVLVEDAVLAKYGKTKLKKFVKELVPDNSQMNQTFHKSWKKVRDASIEQLVVEQVLHYFSTYGLENLGCYSEDTIYLPYERLKIKDKGGITFYVLRGITAEELAAAVQRMISSGMALSETDLNDLVSVIKKQKLSVDPADSSNREMTVRLYHLLGITPKDPIEYLRLVVYRATDSSLLIKSKRAVEAIKCAMDGNVFAKHNNVFKAYEEEYGLNGLASIFYRFKPIFLAFKNKKSAATVNRIRRLAVKHHRPMPEDYLGSVTKNLRNGTLCMKELRANLAKANVFRKVRLIQALQFYNNKEASGVVYSVRNGKSYTTTINPMKPHAKTNKVITAVLDSMAEDLSHLRGKKVYMDANLTVPTSGKMFCGDVPFGSYFSTKNSLVLGVSWKDLPNFRVDLDLSMVSVYGKTGWDGAYRNDDLLFSGDITAAPNGATEAHLVRARAGDGIYLLNLNFYNGYGTDQEVPYTLFVTKENEYKRMNKDSMMAQKKMLFWSESAIGSDNKQKTIGVLKIKNGVKTFHLFESKIGHGMSARCDERSKNMVDYYDKYLDSLLGLQDLVEWAGAKLVDDPKEADIDLSLKSLTKDALIELLVGE